jgi:diguanylate cyclase (GGDEF)-like protein/PAS domain S-box-containing protein
LFKNLSAGQKITLVSVGGIVLIALMGWFAYSSTTELIDSFHWVYHSHEVLEKIQDLTGELDDIQRSGRGYVITGQDSQLAAYTAALHVLPQTFKEVADLLKDNPNQRHNLVLLESDINDLIDRYAKIVKLRKTRGLDRTALYIKNGAGFHDTNSSLKVIDQMNEEENYELVLRKKVETNKSKKTQWTLFVVTFFSALLIIGAGTNINRHIQAEKIAAEKLREKDATTIQFLESLPIGVYVAEADGKPFYANQTALNLLGRVPDLKDDQTRAEAYQLYMAGTDHLYPVKELPSERALQGKKTNIDNMEIHRPDGTIIPTENWGTPIFGSDGKINYALSAFMDISERKKFQAELKNLSIHDELTGLLNRRGFMTLAEQQQKIANRAKTLLLMLFIDLDGLKKVNDGQGHQAGDKMLTEFAAILKAHFRKTDIVARMGGDEFAVLVSDKPNEGPAIIQRLRDRVEARNKQKDHPYPLDFSLGSTLYDPAKPCDLDQLISQSDKRMYEEKKRKKDYYV